MKKTFFISLFMMTLCFASQTTYAQDKAESVEDPIRDQFVKTYAWTKAFFENTSEPVVAMKKMQTAEGHEYLLMESKASRTLYDISGKQYCTDNAKLDCIEFYKLKDGDLAWERS